MRWAFLLIVFLSHLALPVVSGVAMNGGRENSNLEFTAPDEVYVHQNETVSTYITVHNKADQNQAFTIEPLSLPNELSVVGLPKTEVLVPNHLKQMAFGIQADVNAPFQNYTVSFSITSDLDATVNETVVMEVHVVPWSNLNFGVDDFIAFTVDELVRTSVAVNLTNNATQSDDVTFNLYTSSNWNWGWDMVNTNGPEAYITMAPDTLSYVYLWVDIPAVVDGAPLAGTGPRFTLSAVSGLDKAVSTWNFDLLMNEKRNVSIDEIETSTEVAPNQDVRVNAVVRNVGNTPNTLNITLQGLTASGEPLSSMGPADRFNDSGWVVALFGGLEGVVLQPNQSRVIEIGFLAPNEFQGEMHVELQVFASGAKANTMTARTVAVINRTSSATLTYEASGCQAIIPNQTCDVTFSVENTGNSYNSFLLRDGGTSDGFTLKLPSETLLLQPNEIKIFTTATIQASPVAMAFTLGESTIQILDDTGSVVDEVSVSTKVAPVISWSFRNVEEQVNAKGRLSIAMEVRNEGNAVDGLIVQLQSSHSVDMGFIPPDIAVYEEGVEYPRSFEINDIPLNSNFTIRAWVQLPQDQSTNGTVYVNTTIRSRLSPELPFVHTSTGDYLGVAWQPQPNSDDGIDWGGMADTVALYVKAWWGVVASILVAGVIIYKAVIDRERRLEQEGTLPYQQTENSADDWMSQYKEKDVAEIPATTVQPTQSVPKEAYEAMFRHQHGAPEPSRTPVDTNLVSAATVVLDARTEEAKKSQADSLLESIESGDRHQPLDANRELMPVKEENVPLPSSNNEPNEPIDDLEF